MDDLDRGPTMICATKVLQSSGARVGRLAGIQLPRTIRLLVLVSSGIGVLVGVLAGAAIHTTFASMLYGAIFGGTIGYVLVTFSPLQGESMLKWLELQFNSARRSRYIDGDRVVLAVGTAILAETPRGPVRLMRSAVRIPPTQYDERGVLISAANDNLPLDGSIDPRLFAALNLPGERAMTMSPVDDSPLLGVGARAGAARRRLPTRQQIPGRRRKTTARPEPTAAEGSLSEASPRRLRD